MKKDKGNVSDKKLVDESWRIGNTNAKRYSKIMDANVTFRCNSEDKERWQAEAKSREMSLNEWANTVLNQEIKENQ